MKVADDTFTKALGPEGPELFNRFACMLLSCITKKGILLCGDELHRQCDHRPQAGHEARGSKRGTNLTQQHEPDVVSVPRDGERVVGTGRFFVCYLFRICLMDGMGWDTELLAR